MNRKINLVLLLLAFLLHACGSPAASPSQPAGTGKLKVVATTTIVGDVVRNISGEAIQVSTLLPVNSDPHTFEASPQDAARLAEAKVIFANGAGLEGFLEPLLKSAGSQAKVVSVSDGIQLQQAQGPEAGEHPGGDPHTWFDPNNVIVWAQNIEKELADIDPANAAIYTANSQKYQGELRDLDGWIRNQVAQIPEANRKLVADHTSLTYFASRYGFQQVGAVLPAYSTLSQPSAQELAALEDSIRSQGVKAIFVEKNVNSALAQRVAQDTGVQLVTLYNGSLSGPDGPAVTYLDFMKYDVEEMVKALR